MSIYQKLLEISKTKGAGFLVLLDPDKIEPNKLREKLSLFEENGVDGILIGSSLLLNTGLDEIIKEIKSSINIPVIIFPGNAYQVSRWADAILFLSLVSGRNPNFLIGEHVKAASVIKEFNLEAIPTGYMIFDSGKMTSVLFMSDTKPIPFDKPDIAKTHALAAQYLGMKMIYLEAGSGAKTSIPDEVVSEVREYISLPMIVGGGIKDPQVAQNKVKNGADFLVLGNALETNSDSQKLKEMADAIHFKTK